MAARDRFNDLPDRLICTHILTKLSLKDAIRCSAVSRIWKRFWTLLPDLRFTREFLISINEYYCMDSIPGEIRNIIDNILLLRSAHIKAFEIHEILLFGPKIHHWLLFVASKGVREITLKYDLCDDDNRLEVPSALFSCDKLVYLELEVFHLTRIPAYFGGFQFLEKFRFCSATLNEEGFEQLIKLCPRLQTLILMDVILITNLKLDSQSLKTLYLEYLEIEASSSITINCPQLTTLVVKVCPLPVTTKFEVNCPLLVQLATTESRILEGIPVLKSLRKLIMWDVHDVKILRKFPNIEELCINYLDSLPQAPRLKKLHILQISLGHIAVLSHLSKNMPSLQTMTISLQEGFNSVNELQIVNGLLSVMSPTIKVILSQQNSKKETCCSCHWQTPLELISV